MEEKTKITIKEYYACVKCGKKMESIKWGTADVFSFFSGEKGALYCDNKECDGFGYLTVAGVKKTE